MGFSTSDTKNMDESTDGNKNEDDNESDFQTKLLEQMIENNADPEDIEELTQQIMDENKDSKKCDELCCTDIPDPTLHMEIVNRDLEEADENIPEFFVQQNMLYVNCSINDIYIKAFVDTGAQICVMNLKTAVKCGLYNRIDTRAKHTLVGVGTKESLGYVYNVDLFLGQYICPCNFVVTRGGHDIMIGINFMRTHKVTLDIGSNIFKIGTLELTFLNENEIKG